MLMAALRAFRPAVGLFDPEFCKQTIVCLFLEIRFLLKEKQKALAFLQAIEAEDMTNPIRIIAANDVENYIKGVDIKMNVAAESILELNTRMFCYNLERNILAQNERVEDVEAFLDEGVEADIGRDSPAFSVNSESSGYSLSSDSGCSSVSMSSLLRLEREDSVALLGGLVPYFILDENTLPKSLYGS